MSMTNEEASNILRLVATESFEGVSRFIESEKNRDLYKRAYEMAIKSLEESVAVVRCKDCKHRFVDGENVRFNCCELNHNKVQSDDWFCADGENDKNESA